MSTAGLLDVLTLRVASAAAATVARETSAVAAADAGKPHSAGRARLALTTCCERCSVRGCCGAPADATAPHTRTPAQSCGARWRAWWTYEVLPGWASELAASVSPATAAAHVLLAAWGMWVLVYCCMWGRYAPDALATPVLRAWAICMGVTFVLLEPAAAACGPVARTAGAVACRPCTRGLRWLPGCARALRPFDLPAAVSDAPLTLRLRYVTVLRAAGHASSMRPHVAFAALAPSWLLAAVALEEGGMSASRGAVGPPPPTSAANPAPSGALAALRAASLGVPTLALGGAGGIGRSSGLPAHIESRQALSLRRYTLALLRGAAARLKAPA
jgi:hypothetical protein